MNRDLLIGHKEFRARFFEERSFLHKLAVEGQKPKALVIGCSDSRVVPEYLTSAGIGDLFVLRNIANHVPVRPHDDVSAGAAIEYAVSVLNVPDIIVIGHYGCGGVKAALDGLGTLNPGGELKAWLGDLMPSIDKARASGLSGDALWRHAVEEHVLGSIDNLLTHDGVKQRLEAGTLHVHGWVYDVYSSRLNVFDCDSQQWVDALTLRKTA